MKSSGLNRGKPLERKTELRSDPESDRAFQQRGRESGAKSLQQSARKSARENGHRPGAISPASKEQRTKVRDANCVVCARDQFDTAIDPAHLIPRTMGSGNHPLDVVPLCRDHHRAYDDGKLDLLPHLEPRWRDEVAQAVRHVGLVAALQRITNERWSANA